MCEKIALERYKYVAKRSQMPYNWVNIVTHHCIARINIMTFKESLLAVGTSLFVCSGTVGVMFFIALFIILDRMGE